MAPDVLQALRRRLEATYGLALAAVSDDQLARAVKELGPGTPLEQLPDHLPISESSLMRDAELWTWLGERTLPEALGAAELERAPLRVLSLGCSEGQEAFSFAIRALAAGAKLGLSASAVASRVEIVGLDISSARVTRARSGLLAEWSVRAAPEPEVAAHLQRTPDGWQVSQRARALCHFEVGNLLALPPAQLAAFDVVLCRHVLIYFEQGLAQTTLAQLASALEPGALLAVAPVEAHLLPPRLPPVPGAPVGVVRLPPTADLVSLPVSGGRPKDRGASAPAGAPGAPASTSHGAESLRARALRAADEGRPWEAVTHARAATFLEPAHLGGRFLLARLYLAVDRPQGRRLLQAVLDEARRSSGSDPDLSHHQLALAASALLASAP